MTDRGGCYRLGVDVGETTTAFGAIDLDGIIVVTGRFETQVGRDPEVILKTIAGHVASLLEG